MIWIADFTLRLRSKSADGFREGGNESLIVSSGIRTRQEVLIGKVVFSGLEANYANHHDFDGKVAANDSAFVQY